MRSLRELVQKGIPDSLIECFVNRHKSYTLFDRKPDTMTDLQEDVFFGDHAEDFWSGKDLFIQGQTSAGKTLIAEVAAARCFQEEPTKKIIYLVPYRALVSEKYPTFCSSMQSIGKYEVFPSSADYQNFDVAISNGNYDLLITVYEKLFAFLAMGNRMVLNNIGLIIIDELQMFSEPNRGPKMEMILAKIKSMDASRRPQIIGLTTPSYDCSLIAKHFSATIIKNTKRSVELVEYFSDLNGNGVKQKTSVDGKTGEPEKCELPFVSSKNLDSAILQIVNQVITPAAPVPDENPRCKKILIFRSTRKRAMQTALDIAKHSRLHMMSAVEAFPAELIENLEDDEYSNEICNCVKYGTAFHHAGLSFSLRKRIEEEFSKENGLVKVLVATETLSVGVNFPSDVVIVIDREIPSDEDGRALSGPEYRNYVGRAGRLGASEYGESYMLYESSEDYALYSPKYINVKEVTVGSALAGFAPDGKMPYILFWMTQNSNNFVDIDDLYEGLHNNTLMFYNDSSDSAAKKAMEKSIDYMRRLHLIEEDSNSFDAERTGEILSGFALARATINHINNRIKPLLTKESEPEPFTLDFLYYLCQCSEIQKMGYMALTNVEKDTVGSLKEYIRCERFSKKYFGEKLSETALYRDLFNENSMPNSTKLLSIKRAIVLFLWMKGCEVKEIKKETTFSHLFFADIVRIADIASFISESICILSTQGWNEQTAKRKELIQKITRLLQYGVPQSVIFLASLHNYKLTRRKLVALANSLDAYNWAKDSRPPLRILDYFVEQKHQIVDVEKILTESVYKDVISDICLRYNGGRTTDGVDEVHMCLALNWDRRNQTHIAEDVDAYYRKKDNDAICRSITDLLQQSPFNCKCSTQRDSFILETGHSTLNIAVDIRERADNGGNVIPSPEHVDVFICSTETYGRLVNEETLEYTLITKEGFMTLLLRCFHAKDPVQALSQVLSSHKSLPAKDIPVILANLHVPQLALQHSYHIFATNDQYAAEFVKKFKKKLDDKCIFYKTFITPDTDFVELTAGKVSSEDVGAIENVFFLLNDFESDLPLTNRLKMAINQNQTDRKGISGTKRASHVYIIHSEAIASYVRRYTKNTSKEVSIISLKEEEIRDPDIQTKTINEVDNMKRFKVAFSFPGEHRDKIKEIVEALIKNYGFTEGDILFDEFHKAEFSGPDLAPYLQKLYHDHSEVIVVLVCPEYEKKSWCYNIEWKSINDLITKREGDIMYFSVGDPKMQGVFSSQDGIISIERESLDNCAKLIYDRCSGKKRMDI